MSPLLNQICCIICGLILRMKIYSLFFIPLLLLFFSQSLYCQSSNKKINHPLEDPVGISGSFGEYRNFSRYHMGLDYKTWTINGLRVNTPFSGKVLGMSISENRGYGNALFIKTPDGKTLTFAHLLDFNCLSDSSDKFSDLEYFRMSLKVLTQDRYLRLRVPGYYKFNAGSCIARTGESGSGPPHLHFEMIKNGVFLDPLSVFGMTIPDHTPPKLLTLFLETDKVLYRFKLVLQKSQPGKRVYKPEEPLPLFQTRSRLRIMVGGYDTMAARNRNGVYSLSLDMNQKNIYRKTLDRIRPAELGNSSQIYHTAYTQIGREYVYLLYRAGTKGYLVSKKLTQFQARLADASGNRAILDFSIMASSSPKNTYTRVETSARPRPEIRFKSILQGNRNHLNAVQKNSKISIRFKPASLQMNGKARLFSLQQLPQKAREKLMMPVGHTGIKKQTYIATSPGYYLDGLGLYYRLGGTGTAVFKESGTNKDGLYYFSSAKSIWRLLAHPYKKNNGYNYYRFKVRFIGPVTQLQDVSAPGFSKHFAWKKPDLLSSNKKILIREYPVLEWGSGLDFQKTTVLVNGMVVPWEWVVDRSVIRIMLPVSMLKNNTMISVQVGDRVGNLSKWHIEMISKGWLNKS